MDLVLEIRPKCGQGEGGGPKSPKFCDVLYVRSPGRWKRSWAEWMSLQQSRGEDDDDDDAWKYTLDPHS